MTETTLISFVTAFVVPFLTQILKRRSNLSGARAYWAHITISFALAVFIVVATGRFDLTNVFTSLAVIISVAQTIYQSFLRNK